MNTFKRIDLYYYTIRHLKPKQLYFQVLTRLKKYFQERHLGNKDVFIPKTFPLNLQSSIPSSNSYYHDKFIFLNKEKQFEGKIDWNFSGFGKLWTYNLNYFEYLNRDKIDIKTAVGLIDDFCVDPERHKEGLEPYPISLRGVNWLKFFSYQGITKPLYDRVLLSHYKHLASNFEYHLLGNHLLENAFSLLFAAYYFRDESFYRKAKRILESELSEQVLADGAHFELSPMYHQIILFRLLDAINLVKNNEWHNASLLPLLHQKAEAMLAWLKAITFQNGDIPMVNDSAHGIAPTSHDLYRYAERLEINSKPSTLSDSGYEMVRAGNFELFIDIGNIGPDYIPGHAHSDTFNFILYRNGRPLIVDTGTSTYDAGSRRFIERSTKSHNTVIVNEEEQSQIWAAFRVGRRAKIINRVKDQRKVVASHDGYKSMRLVHYRSWEWKDNEIKIVDEIKGKSSVVSSIASIHFYTDLDVKIDEQSVNAGPLRIDCTGQENLTLADYDLATGFNTTTRGKVLRIHFTNRLETTLSLK